MRQTLSSSKILLAGLTMVCMLAATEGAYAGKQIGVCPDARPGQGAMYLDQLGKYGDWRSNPDHTYQQYLDAEQTFDARNSCALWIRLTGGAGMDVYYDHIHAQTQQQKQFTSLPQLKKRLYRGDPSPLQQPKKLLERKMDNAALAMAYKGKTMKAIEKKLYCECTTSYPTMVKAQKKYEKAHYKPGTEYPANQ